MKKKIAALIIGAVLLGATTAAADWETGALHHFRASGGTSAVNVTLSSWQRLKLQIDAEQNMCSADFFYGDPTKDTEEEATFRVEIPGGVEKEMTVTLLPFVNTGNGRRFYVLDTGTPQGTLLIAYAKGEYHIAFSADTLAGDFVKSEIAIEKKEIFVRLEDENGNSTSYPLTYDNKTKMFTAVGARIKETVSEEKATEENTAAEVSEGEISLDGSVVKESRQGNDSEVSEVTGTSEKE